jgi:aquaporin Z
LKREADVNRKTTSAGAALRQHWPEYLIEGWALGMFMISAGTIATLIEHPASPLRLAIGSDTWRRVAIGVAMGLTAIVLIYSPWGKRSGAHMNPAVTLAFLHAGRVNRWDAVFYILAQFIGGAAGVVLVLALLGHAFAAPPVNYVATLPGPLGWQVALLAEFVISLGMMTMVLRVSSSPRFMRLTGLGAGLLVAIYISLEAPLSGMSMNPARSVASALPGHLWSHLWIYLIGPVAGMQSAVLIDRWLRGPQAVSCAKLVHTPQQRCIFCGHEPGRAIDSLPHPLRSPI